MSDWTCLSEIIRDLSVAQRRLVPARVEPVGEIPPPLHIKEETEEDYYPSSGDVDFSQPPDFHLIKQMIHLVNNDRKCKADTSVCDIAISSTLNPLSLEFIPGMTYNVAVKKKSKRRNAAIESILKTLEISGVNIQNESNKSIDTDRKSPIGMFRRKRKEDIKVVTVIPPESKSRNIKDSRQYVPSQMADVYYKKYMENARLKQQIQEDLWMRVEPQLKVSDERQMERQQMLGLSPCSSMSTQSCSTKSRSSNETSTKNLFRYDLYRVGLSELRHSTIDNIEDCIVCNVAAKHGYRFVEEETP